MCPPAGGGGGVGGAERISTPPPVTYICVISICCYISSILILLYMCVLIGNSTAGAPSAKKRLPVGAVGDWLCPNMPMSAGGFTSTKVLCLLVQKYKY